MNFFRFFFHNPRINIYLRQIAPVCVYEPAFIRGSEVRTRSAHYGGEFMDRLRNWKRRGGELLERPGYMFEYIRLLVTARREECAARICEYHRGGAPVISGDWVRTRVECTEVITSRWIVVNDRRQGKISAILSFKSY